MLRLSSLFALLLSVVALALAKSSTGDSVLVVLDQGAQRDDYSLFFDGLESQGYKLTFRAPKDAEPAVIEDGVPAFSHLILLSSETKSYAQDITPQSLVTLLELGTNILFTLGSKQTPLSSLATEFSFILPPPGTPLISHFPARSEPAHVIPITVPSSLPASSALSPSLKGKTVWFSGAPHAFGSNPLFVPLLNAPAESFAADTTTDSGADALVDAAEKGGEGLWAGSTVGVVTGFQILGGARAVWAGGVGVFSDEFARKEGSANEAFARDVAAWAFQENMVLRIDNSTHHRVGEALPRDKYTTSDEVTYTTHISKYNPTTSAWEPYSGITDLQLEFTMLDPHIRTALAPVAGKPGLYSVTFRAPDRHGVFKFVVDYKRKGWTHLRSETVVPVVPPRHDEYPRFLSAAWPYYAGAISTSVGFLLFSAIWLAGDDRDSRKKKTSKVE